MGRRPCCDNQGLKKRAWSSKEDELLINYINQHHGNWRSLPKNAGLKKGLWSPEEDQLLINCINQHGPRKWPSIAKIAGLQRSGKSCRIRWINHLRPGIKHGPFNREEENLVIQLQTTLGNRWSEMAIQLPGRSDNGIKNFWNNRLRKQLVTRCLDPQTSEPAFKAHGPKPRRSPSTRHMAQWESARLEAEARLSRESLKCEDVEVIEDSKSHIQLLNARSNSSGSDVVDDSSVSKLQLLLDFSENNDTSFLENDIYDSDVVDDSSVSELPRLVNFPENNDTSYPENDIYDYLVYPSDSSND